MKELIHCGGEANVLTVDKIGEALETILEKLLPNRLNPALKV